MPQSLPPFEPLWSERYAQHFHDRNEPVQQSEHVFLAGSGTSTHAAPRVLEIGFGLGLNFRTTLGDCLRRGVPLQYLAFEHDPQSSDQLRDNAVNLHQTGLAAWHALTARWPETPCRVISDGVELEVHFVDATKAQLPEEWATAIYLDGFSSAVNPELWSDGFIEKLAHSLAPGGWLSTYSAAGHVRRAIKAAGLKAERTPGWGTKREYLRAQRPAT